MLLVLAHIRGFEMHHYLAVEATLLPPINIFRFFLSKHWSVTACLV